MADRSIWGRSRSGSVPRRRLGCTVGHRTVACRRVAAGTVVPRAVANHAVSGRAIRRGAVRDVLDISGNHHARRDYRCRLGVSHRRAGEIGVRVVDLHPGQLPPDQGVPERWLSLSERGQRILGCTKRSTKRAFKFNATHRLNRAARIRTCQGRQVDRDASQESTRAPCVSTMSAIRHSCQRTRVCLKTRYACSQENLNRVQSTKLIAKILH